MKAQAHHLSNYRDEAGIRIHIANYLLRDFEALMKMSYIWKKKKKRMDLESNVKFDEENTGLYMDMQVRSDGPRQRVRPNQARQVIPDPTLWTPPPGPMYQAIPAEDGNERARETIISVKRNLT